MHFYGTIKETETDADAIINADDHCIKDYSH